MWGLASKGLCGVNLDSGAAPRTTEEHMGGRTTFHSQDYVYMLSCVSCALRTVDALHPYYLRGHSHVHQHRSSADVVPPRSPRRSPARQRQSGNGIGSRAPSQQQVRTSCVAVRGLGAGLQGREVWACPLVCFNLKEHFNSPPICHRACSLVLSSGTVMTLGARCSTSWWGAISWQSSPQSSLILLPWTQCLVAACIRMPDVPTLAWQRQFVAQISTCSSPPSPLS